MIDGGGLQLGSTTRPGNNVIIRNITFINASDDSVSVTNSAHHVWIDHNTFRAGFDGSVDVKRQSSYVTVSWNHFDHTDKSMLLGHSDGFTADVGHLRVTYHHNFFNGSNQRHPRARFGEPVHVYNNYYLGNGLYGIASTENAGRAGRGQLLRERRVPVLLDQRLRRLRAGPAGPAQQRLRQLRRLRGQRVRWPSRARTTRTHWTVRPTCRPWSGPAPELAGSDPTAGSGSRPARTPVARPLTRSADHAPVPPIMTWRS